MTTGAAPGRRAPRCTSSLAATRLAKKHFLTAGECLQRAGVYYHFASFLFVHDQAQMKAAHKKQIECRQAALPHLRRRASASKFPIRARRSPAFCASLKAPRDRRSSSMAVGLDSTKEETDAYEAPFLARGMATLVFEGPGQGEAQYDFPIRGDYEVPVKAVLDLRRHAARPRRRAHRDVGRQPRRLLRAARSSLRQAHQGLYRARRAVQLGARPGTGCRN